MQELFDKPSLVTRIAVGKAVGMAVGLLGLVFLTYFAPDAGWLLRIGIVLWYTTVGAIIGLMGVFDRHPVFRLPLPWWFRAPLVGGWMNFVLTFFAFDTMRDLLVAFFGTESMLTSPWWFTLEGAVVGLVIGYAATRLGGEGRETVPA